MGIYGHFLIFHVYTVDFECVSHSCLAPKRKKQKIEEKGPWHIKSPRSHFSQRERGLQQPGEVEQQRLPASLSYLCDQKEQSMIRAQVPSICGKESFCPPSLPQAVCELLQEHMHSFLQWKRGMGS